MQSVGAVWLIASPCTTASISVVILRMPRAHQPNATIKDASNQTSTVEIPFTELPQGITIWP